MTPTDRNFRPLLYSIMFVIGAWASPAAMGQDDDDIVDDRPIVPQAVMPVQVVRGSVQP